MWSAVPNALLEVIKQISEVKQQYPSGYKSELPDMLRGNTSSLIEVIMSGKQILDLKSRF